MRPQRVARFERLRNRAMSFERGSPISSRKCAGAAS
jgi:hypothetical protein